MIASYALAINCLHLFCQEKEAGLVSSAAPRPFYPLWGPNADMHA